MTGKDFVSSRWYNQRMKLQQNPSCLTGNDRREKMRVLCWKIKHLRDSKKFGTGCTKRFLSSCFLFPEQQSDNMSPSVNFCCLLHGELVLYFCEWTEKTEHEFRRHNICMNSHSFFMFVCDCEPIKELLCRLVISHFLFSSADLTETKMIFSSSHLLNLTDFIRSFVGDASSEFDASIWKWEENT